MLESLVRQDVNHDDDQVLVVGRDASDDTSDVATKHVSRCSYRRARRGGWSSAPGPGIGCGQLAAQVAVVPGPVPVPWKPKLVDCPAPTRPL
ncbi:hypothetical protein ABZU25_00520 [Micromonospora sp. NPDC005215]|uniref:hypothetical protein n=1 Tax=Micromonospora sp. NPDC005215 TaxID=3157024 RepID=UPI0033B38E64